MTEKQNSEQHESEQPEAKGRGENPAAAPESAPVEGTLPTDQEVSKEAVVVHPAKLVDQPAKVMRIGTMVKQLLEEVKSAPLDDAARARLAQIHRQSITELEDGLAPELVSELERLALPFTEGDAPTDAELRIAQAQLVGWLEGLFHGIQTAIAAQAVENQKLAAQLQMHQLPPGTVIAPGVIVGENGEPVQAPTQGAGQTESSTSGPGQYL